MLDENLFISAEDIAKVTGMSVAYAYKLVKQLNKELEDKGFFTIRGRVSKQYFEERFYGVRLQEGDMKYARLQR